jgi:hypothetical protein
MNVAASESRQIVALRSTMKLLDWITGRYGSGARSSGLRRGRVLEIGRLAAVAV